MTTDDRRVKVNGVELHVRTAGSGHPLVLLHGWPQTSYCWRKIIPALASKFSVIAPDLRGFADSDKPAAGYDKRTVARDIEALLGVLGHRRAVVGGHDIGARVAFRLALDRPELVERLVILSGRYPPLGTSRMFEPPQALERWYFFFHQLPELPEILVSDHVEDYLRHFLTHWSHRPNVFTEADIAEYVRAFSQPGALSGGFNHYRAALNEDVPQWNADAGRVVDIPTLVLWGRNDPVSPPEWTDGYPRVFRRLTLKFFDDCGHFLHEEQPEATARDILAFLANLA